MEVVESLICMAKFPWAAHSTINWAAHFFHIKKQWAAYWAAHCAVHLFLYMEVVGSLIWMEKFPWAAHVQPMGSEVGSSPVFSVWVPTLFSELRLEMPTEAAHCVI